MNNEKTSWLKFEEKALTRKGKHHIIGGGGGNGSGSGSGSTIATGTVASENYGDGKGPGESGHDPNDQTQP